MDDMQMKTLFILEAVQTVLWLIGHVTQSLDEREVPGPYASPEHVQNVCKVVAPLIFWRCVSI